MTFKRRLLITFLIILFIPLILTYASFQIIGSMVARMEGGEGYRTYDTLDRYSEEMSSLFGEIHEDYEKNPDCFENEMYLENMGARARDTRSVIVIKKDEDIYYTSSESAAARVGHLLPVKMSRGAGPEASDTYYLSGTNCLVKQLSFTYPDGSLGNLYVVRFAQTLVSRRFMFSMFAAIALILGITAMALTYWLKRGLVEPIGNLSVAMRNIRDGNLSYTLPTDQEGEMGDLYRSYEDMRLRLKESADEKLERENMNRDLIRNICHDLKTPITSVKGYVEGLIDGVANTPDKQQKYLQTILNKTNDMNKLINELTLYSTIDNDRIPYHFAKVNVTNYFGDCVEELGIDMEQKGIALNYSNLIDPDTVIIADPEQLKRVIDNIVGNSVKYIDKLHGILEIRILDEQDLVRVEIEDNGKGIAAKDLPQIFDRFYRTDSSRNSAQGGSGIGLSIVKKIIEDHGGYIWATSKEGEGTCMHFVLRKYREKAQESTVDTSAQEKA